MIDYEVAVVIPAAGQSERFPGECPKQYFPILGKPLFMHCVEAFLSTECIKKICIVSDRVEYVKELLRGKSEKLMVVAGGPSRHASIKNGLIALKKLGNYFIPEYPPQTLVDTFFRVVVVHDGARPIVPEQLLKELIVEADRVGAAGAIRPLTSTVLRPGPDGCVDSCLDRGSHVASETPQAFSFEMLSNAYEKAGAEDLEHGTECLALALKYAGVRAKLIPGPNTLWKVTEKKDYHASEACLRELSTRVLILCEEETTVVKDLKNSLDNKVSEVKVETSKRETTEVFGCKTLVLFHSEKPLSKISFTEGLTMHVMLNFPLPSSQNFTMEDLFKMNGENITTQNGKTKKDHVLIIVKSLDHHRLIRLVTHLILSDSDLFSGNTFII